MAAVSRRMLVLTSVGLVRTALLITGLAIVSFGLPNLVLGGFAAAFVGLVLYVGILALLRPRGLVEAWRYVRVLHN